MGEAAAKWIGMKALLRSARSLRSDRKVEELSSDATCRVADARPMGNPLF